MALPEKRWIQRFDSFQKAFAVLERICDIQNERELTEAEKMGMIQSFDFSFELAWNLMKDYLNWKGIMEIVGSKDAIRQAYKNGIIVNGEIWMDMIERRNDTSHTYDEKIAEKVVNSVLNLYAKEMKELLIKMESHKQDL
jgi:nucleotidyltransferase substrate binding protein (TIGR01987 family)